MEKIDAILQEAQDAVGQALNTARTMMNRFYETSILSSKNLNQLVFCYDEFAANLGMLQKKSDRKQYVSPGDLDAVSQYAGSIIEGFRKAVLRLNGMSSARSRHDGKGSFAPVFRELVDEFEVAKQHAAIIASLICSRKEERSVVDTSHKEPCLSLNGERKCWMGSEKPHECRHKSQTSGNTNAVVKGEVRSRVEIFNRADAASRACSDLFHATFFVPQNPRYVALNFYSMDARGSPSTAEGKLKAVVLSNCGITPKITAIVGPEKSGKSCILRGLGHDEDIRQRYVDGCYYLEVPVDADHGLILRELCSVVRLSGGEATARSMANQPGLGAVLDETRTWFQNRACLFLVDNAWNQNKSEGGLVAEILDLASAGPHCALVFTTQDVTAVAPSIDFNVIPVANASFPSHMQGQAFLETCVKTLSDEVDRLRDQLNELENDQTAVHLRLRDANAIGRRVQSALIQRLGYLNSKTEDILIRLRQSVSERSRREHDLDDLIISQYSQNIHLAKSRCLPFPLNRQEGGHQDSTVMSADNSRSISIISKCIQHMEEHAREVSVETESVRQKCMDSERKGDRHRFNSTFEHGMKRLAKLEECIEASYEELDALEDQSHLVWKQLTIREFDSFVNEFSLNMNTSDHERLDTEVEHRVQQQLIMKRFALKAHMSEVQTLLEAINTTGCQDCRTAINAGRLRRERAKIALERAQFELLDKYLMSKKSLVQRVFVNHVRQSPRVEARLLISMLEGMQSFDFRDIFLAHRLASYQMKRSEGFGGLFESTDTLRCFFLETLYGKLVDISLSEGQAVLTSKMLAQARNLGMISVDGASSLILVLRLKKVVDKKLHNVIEAVSNLYDDFFGCMAVLDLQFSSVETALYRLKSSQKQSKRAAMWAALVKLGLSMIPIAGQIAGAAVDMVTEGVDVLTDTVLSEASGELLVNFGEIFAVTAQTAVDLLWNESDSRLTYRQRENASAVKLGRLMLSKQVREKMSQESRQKLTMTVESVWGARVDDVEKEFDTILTQFNDVESFLQLEVDDRDLYGKDVFSEKDFLTESESVVDEPTLVAELWPGSYSTSEHQCRRVLVKQTDYQDSEISGRTEKERTTIVAKDLLEVNRSSEGLAGTMQSTISKIGELLPEDQMVHLGRQNFRSTLSDIYGESRKTLYHDEAVMVLKGLFKNDELDWLPVFVAEGVLLDSDLGGTYRVTEDQFSLAVKRLFRVVKETQQKHFSTLWAEHFVDATPPATGLANVALVCRLICDLKKTVPEERNLCRIVAEHSQDGAISLAQFSAIVHSLSLSKDNVI